MHRELKKAENGKAGLLPASDSAASRKAAEAFLEGCRGQRRVQAAFPISQPWAGLIVSCVPSGCVGTLASCCLSLAAPSLSDSETRFAFVAEIGCVKRKVAAVPSASAPGEGGCWGSCSKASRVAGKLPPKGGCRSDADREP